MPELAKMNLNYLLNNAYYEKIDYANFADCNKKLCEREYGKSDERIAFVDTAFCLKTVYPGLLIGIGNTHQTGMDVADDKQNGSEIKLGFTLDYVTGLPVIPGSTVKGILRSAFHRVPEYVAELLHLDSEQVAEIENSIFENGMVVFFDAVPIKPGKDSRLLGLDSITPHHFNYKQSETTDSMDLLKNPNPLTMLKVIPNVVFLFRFGFENWNDAKGIATDALKQAFADILTTLGVGAKTNVGYGGMEAIETPADLYSLQAICQKSNQASSVQNLKNKGEGICAFEDCTEETKWNGKAKKYYPYCQRHNPATQKKGGYNGIAK